ncbi:MAG: hypothetical protein IIW79_04410 [Clostridia bacterium]|nr:hypothetical protein [Clostridia bacterium]
MKSLKTIISLLVALCIIATMSVVAFAEESSVEEASSVVEVTETTQEKLDANKIVKFDKFDGENFDGDTDKIGTNGLLYANGKEVNGLTYCETLDLGKTWQASVTINRENKDTAATKNCLGEKYELVVGDVTLKIGNQQEGVSQYIAELWYKDEKIGYVQLDSNFSGTYGIRFTQDGTQVGKLYVIKDNTTMAWNVVDSTLVSVDSANGVTSYYNVKDADFSAAKISVVAAGNNSKDKTNYAYGLWFAKKFYSTTRTGNGTLGTTGTTSGSTGGNSGKTGDSRTVLPFVAVVVTLLAAGACVVLTAKKSCKE